MIDWRTYLNLIRCRPKNRSRLYLSVFGCGHFRLFRTARSSYSQFRAVNLWCMELAIHSRGIANISRCSIHGNFVCIDWNNSPQNESMGQISSCSTMDGRSNAVFIDNSVIDILGTLIKTASEIILSGTLCCRSPQVN